MYVPNTSTAYILWTTDNAVCKFIVYNNCRPAHVHVDVFSFYGRNSGIWVSNSLQFDQTPTFSASDEATNLLQRWPQTFYAFYVPVVQAYKCTICKMCKSARCRYPAMLIVD